VQACSRDNPYKRAQRASERERALNTPSQGHCCGISAHGVTARCLERASFEGDSVACQSAVSVASGCSWPSQQPHWVLALSLCYKSRSPRKNQAHPVAFWLSCLMRDVASLHKPSQKLLSGIHGAGTRQTSSRWDSGKGRNPHINRVRVATEDDGRGPRDTRSSLTGNAAPAARLTGQNVGGLSQLMLERWPSSCLGLLTVLTEWARLAQDRVG